MVKLTGPLHSQAASGRLDSAVYAQHHAASHARQHTIAKQANTPAQQKWRSLLVSQSNAWSKLDTPEHKAWVEARYLELRTSIRGKKCMNTGYHRYVAMNARLRLMGFRPRDWPPGAPCSYILTAFKAAQDPHSVLLTWETDAPPPPGTHAIEIWRQRAPRPGRKPDPYHAVILAYAPLEALEYHDTTAQAGQFTYWGRCVDCSSGDFSPHLTDTITTTT
jgi:hypothetical protein